MLGLIILSVALVKFFVFPLLSNNDVALKVDKINLSQKEISEPKSEIENRESEGTIIENKINSSVTEITIEKPFDPNTYSFEDWQKTGLPDKFCKTISHFQEKGGKFRKPEDLKKVWGMRDEWYEKIAPFVQINSIEKSKTESFATATNHYTPKKKSIIELNTADSLQLDSLPLIGMKTANRIIKYRNLLGGFYAIEQLKEVWGLKDSVLLVNANRIRIDNNLIKKINANTATIDEMKKHPYLHYNKAAAIFNYRKNHGNYKSINDLMNTKMFTEEDLKKIEPYLGF